MDLIGQVIAEQQARAEAREERRQMEAEIQARIRQAFGEFLRDIDPALYAAWLDGRITTDADHAATAV